MTASVSIEVETTFKKECRIINLKREYPHYSGTIQWAIATDLSENELRIRFKQQIAEYEPFIILTMEQALAIVKFHSNERKHAIRNASLGDAFAYEDGESEKYHAEIISDPFDDGPDMTYLYDAIENLAPTQRERIRKHFMMGYSFVEIAADEGVSVQAVQQSVTRSLSTLKKILSAR